MINQQEVKEALQAGVVQVTFTKVNGEERIMSCTLSGELMPAPIVEEVVEGAEVVEKKVKKPNPDVLPVYDVKAEGWRSFRWDSVTAYQTEQ